MSGSSHTSANTKDNHGMMGAIISDPVFINAQGITHMTQQEFASLRDGVWLNDAPITFFLKACVQDINRGVHCFCSGFFKFIDLRSEDYHYDSIRAFVRRQFDCYENGINSLKQLFTPINILNTHWIFLRVVFESKRIELYDSNGKNHENRRYMENMRQFLYDEFHKDTPVEERPLYDDWKRRWKCSDRSMNAPRQRNNDDCGIFTLVSIYLLSKGMELTSMTYDQDTIYRRKVRLSIAHIILQRNQIPPGETTLPPRAAGASRRRPTTSAQSKKRSRRGNESRMTSTGTGISPVLTGHNDDINTRRNPISKRTAESLAEDSLHGTSSTQRNLPPAKKRKKKRRTAD